MAMTKAEADELSQKIGIVKLDIHDKLQEIQQFLHDAVADTEQSKLTEHKQTGTEPSQ